jgi:hypothetical protein
MNKITIFSIFMLTVSLTFGQDLLTGGDFEGLPTGKVTPGSTPWDTSVGFPEGQPAIINNSAVAYAGEQFTVLPNDFVSFRQSFTATAGTEYTLSFFYQFIMPQGTPNASDGITISIRQDNGENNGNGTQFDPVISIYLNPSIINSDWQEVNFDFIAPQANLVLFLNKSDRTAGGNNNAARMDEFSITEKTLSVTGLEQFEFETYPNPVSNYLYMRAASSIDKIEVYDLLGKQVINEKIDSKEAQVLTSGIKTGVYILKAFIGESVGTYKFIKK